MPIGAHKKELTTSMFKSSTEMILFQALLLKVVYALRLVSSKIKLTGLRQRVQRNWCSVVLSFVFQC